MRAVCQRAVAEGISGIAFGDLFLQDVRDYRVKQLSGTGLEPLFRLWQIPTGQLSRDMIAAGVKAKITCVDPSKLARSFAGRDYDEDLLAPRRRPVRRKRGSSIRSSMMHRPFPAPSP